MEKTIKFLDKKIITKKITNEGTLTEIWETNVSDPSLRKQYIVHNSTNYYLTSQKFK